MEFNGEVGYEIKRGDKKRIVNLDNKTCIYSSWQLIAIPCIYVVCAMFNSRVKLEDEVDNFYKKGTYLQSYQYSLKLVKGRIFLPQVGKM